MELKIEQIKELEPIKFNYEDIKEWITEKATEYKSIVYTEETITLAKADRATLNKVYDAINNEKKRVKNEVLKPYVDFENQCKELMSIIDDASKCIDSQVKIFESKEQEEKKNKIQYIFNAYIGNFKDLITIDKIFNPRWLNKTFTIKKIQEEINHIIVKTSDDLSVIDSQFGENENVCNQVKNYYLNNINNPSVLSISIVEGNKIIETNKKLEELKKQQEEQKKQQEELKKQQEEQKKQQEEQKKQQETKEEITQVTTEKSPVNNEVDQLEIIDFRVWVTKEQKLKIREFLIQNNIKYGVVPKNGGNK